MEYFNHEIWYEIPNTKGFYSVSDMGQVRSNNRTIIDATGKIRKLKGRILKTYHKEGGYVYVDLGKRNSKIVHRLVAFAHVPNPENKPCVNHKKGIKHDNRASELEWSTYSENERHSYDVLNKSPNVSHLGLKGIECSHSKPVAMLDGEDFTIQAASATLKQMSISFHFTASDIRKVCDNKKPNHKSLLFKWITKEEYSDFVSQAV